MVAVVVQSKVVNLRIVSMIVIVKVGAVLLRIVIVKPVNVLVVTSGRLFAESQNCYLMHLKQLIKREISLGDGSYNIFFEKH